MSSFVAESHTHASSGNIKNMSALADVDTSMSVFHNIENNYNFTNTVDITANGPSLYSSASKGMNRDNNLNVNMSTTVDEQPISWQETKLIMIEVEKLFSRDDDIREIEEVTRVTQETEANRAKNLRDSKDSIKDLTLKVSQKELEISAPTPTQHNSILEKYVADKEKVSNEIEQLRNELDKKRERISKTAMNALNYKEKAEEYNTNVMKSDTRTAYALSLYTKITNISWDYDNTINGKLAGFIGDENSKSVKDFTLDTRSLTSFELANELWDRIEKSL